MGCRNSGLSEYWAVGIAGCRNNLPRSSSTVEVFEVIRGSLLLDELENGNLTRETAKSKKRKMAVRYHSEDIEECFNKVRRSNNYPTVTDMEKSLDETQGDEAKRSGVEPRIETKRPGDETRDEKKEEELRQELRQELRRKEEEMRQEMRQELRRKEEELRQELRQELRRKEEEMRQELRQELRLK
ncbi:unnamed protein product [Mytilus edulis]|uniref:Uncharacterized protein n=1 Tax=Mytilus edulis TaxID=6550 RepID=A0A8S3RKK6_MYTED|nr:unnamed protein product [Mytilus edulis]